MDVMQSTEAQAPAQHAARGDRVARTREAIISSTLTLAQDGEVSPIVRDIAKLAGVSARTVFQHFADTAELYVAVLGRVMKSLLVEAPELNRQWPLDQRIGVVVDQRAERYETVRPMWTFLQTLQRRSADAAAKLLQVYAGNRDQISDSFGPELSALPGEKRERTLNALNVALTPETWIVLRERLGLTVEQAREEWRFIVKAIFSDHH
jgi:AcrR family transcriptional regulator